MTETTDLDAAQTAAAIREHLRTITTHWWATSDPMNLGDGTASTVSQSRIPGATAVLRADVTLTLAFWVHSMVDEWPALLQSLQPDAAGNLALATTASIDCTDVGDMAYWLDREADRLAAWGTYGPTLVEELRPLASAVRSVAKPPRRDSVVIGDCPRCHESVKVRTMHRVPQPTTSPSTYPAWTNAPTASNWQAVITHPCGESMTLEQWHAKLVGKGRPLPAADIVREVHQRLGIRCSAAAVRVWSHRGLFPTRGYSATGHALYDLHEVLEGLVKRDATRAEMAG